MRDTKQRIAGRLLASVLLLALAGGLNSCAPSPTTTYTNDSGDTVTVDWRDYPATAWLSADEVLAGPTTGEAHARWANLLADLKAALDTELGSGSWQALGDAADYAEWHPMPENEYGGRSMLVTFNAQTQAREAIIDRSRWAEVADLVADVATHHGFAERINDELDPEIQRFMRSETLVANSSEWLSITVQDSMLDQSSEETRHAERFGWSGRGVTLFYGVSTVRDEDLAEFNRRAAPYAGLELPAASHPS